MKKFRNEKGELHREDGPAVIYSDGSKEYCINGNRHREDGPAVIWSNGSKQYWINGKRHREDGPAVICSNGHKSYWINGKYYSYEKWLSETNLNFDEIIIEKV